MKFTAADYAGKSADEIRRMRKEAERAAASQPTTTPKPQPTIADAPTQRQIEYARGLARRSGMHLNDAIRRQFGSRINPTRAQMSQLIDALKTYSHEED